MANVGRDNPQVYYNVIPRSENPNVAQLFVTLDEYDTKETPAMFDTLRARFAAYPNARIEVREFENGPPIDAPVAIRLDRAGPGHAARAGGAGGARRHAPRRGRCTWTTRCGWRART